MPLRIKKTPAIEISRSEYNRLRDQYRQAFSMYAGTPPDFEEWAIKQLQRKQKETTKWQ